MRKGLRNVLATLALIGTGYLAKTCIDDRNRNYGHLSHEDFQRMQWCPVRNDDGIIWDNYMETKSIRKNESNWATYQTEVLERNNRNLQGKIEVPCRFTSF